MVVPIMVSIRDWNIKGYTEARAALDQRSRLGYSGLRRRKLGYETYLLEHGDSTISVVHYATPIVTYFPDGTVELNTRGWMTVTTKERLNLFSPVQVYQRDHVWYFGDGTYYHDGTRFGSNGQRCD